MALLKTSSLPSLNAVALMTTRRNSAPEAQSITTETGLAAAKQLNKLAAKAGVSCALAGGVAMHLYGFTRATTDVDMLASARLKLKASRKLSFGGESYQVTIGKRTVTVDWIVRNDDATLFYEAALTDAAMTETGLPIITPEWLVILKKLADRGKDHLDLLWLLRQEGLVDRAQIAALVREHLGRFAFIFLNDLEAVYLEADLMRAKDERDEGYRSSPARKPPARR
jgi:hypothetical protein